MYSAVGASKHNKDKGFAASDGGLDCPPPWQGSGRHHLLGCRALPWGSGLQDPAAGMAPQVSGLGHLTYVLWVFLFFVHLQGQWVFIYHSKNAL